MSTPSHQGVTFLGKNIKLNKNENTNEKNEKTNLLFNLQNFTLLKFCKYFPSKWSRRQKTKTRFKKKLFFRSTFGHLGFGHFVLDTS